MVSPHTVSPNRFCFSANIDENSKLSEKEFNSKFPKLPTRLPLTPNNKVAASSEINKKNTLFKECNFIQNEEYLRDLFYEINPDI